LNGKVLLTIDGGHTARLWDAATGAALGPAFPLPSPPREFGGSIVCLGPDGKTVLFVDKDERFWICDGGTGTVRGRTPALGAAPYMANFSPDGKTFVTGLANGELQLWDAATLKPLGDPIPNPGNIVRGLFSRDGKSILIACEDGSVRLWDLATRKPLIPPLKHQTRVYGLAFAPDGKTIAIGSEDKTARLWDVATGQPIGPILRHTGPVDPVAFLDDGKSLFTSSAECRLFAVPRDLPDEVERMAAWVEVITGLRLDKKQGLIQVLDNAAWLERREQLMELGGPPDTGPEPRLDPILFGPDPTARARSFIERKQWDAAEAAFDEAMRARPFNIGIMMERGDLYAKRGLWSEAAAYYATKAKQYPELAQAHFELGVVLARQAKFGEAVTEYREAIRLQPDDVGFHNALAWLLVICADPQFRDPQQAVASAKKAVQLAPQDGNLWNTLGVALYRAGQFAEAITALERSFRAQTAQNDACDLFFLAMCHHRLGDVAKARECRERAANWFQKHKSQLTADGIRELSEFQAEADAVVGKPPGQARK
jgi:tetratricopeptide (TPR) repeat protein